MPVSPKLYVDQTVSDMLSATPDSWTPNSNTKKLFQAYASAYADYYTSWLSSLKVVGGTVSGGVAPPSGPVTGALLTAAPGTATATGYKYVDDLFSPPDFSIELPDGSIARGSYTPWLKAATKAVSSELDSVMTAWLTGWSVTSLPVVVGGVTAWVASTPPVPGPWTSGTITPFLFNGTSGGTSVQQGLVQNIASTLVERCRGTNVSVAVGADKYVSTPLVASSGESKALFECLAVGVTSMFAAICKTALLQDASGSGGAGVAAPGGVITGTMSALTVAVA